MEMDQSSTESSWTRRIRGKGVYGIRDTGKPWILPLDLTKDIKYPGYIGSGKLHNRRRSHLRKLENGRHFNTHFQRAWTKYGKEAFVFEVLEYTTGKECAVRENWYLKNWNPKYNIQRTVQGLPGFHLAPETKEKIKAFWTPERRREVSGEKSPMFGRIGEQHPVFGRTGELASMYGKRHTPETRKKMSEVQTRRYAANRAAGKPSQTPEARKKMSEAAKKRNAAYQAAGTTAAGEPLSQSPRNIRQRTRMAKSESREKRKAWLAKPENLEKQRNRAKKRIAALTDEQKEILLTGRRNVCRTKRAAETAEEREVRQAKWRAYRRAKTAAARGMIVIDQEEKEEGR